MKRGRGARVIKKGSGGKGDDEGWLCALLSG